jgi:hypothetical protein
MTKEKIKDDIPELIIKKQESDAVIDFQDFNNISLYAYLNSDIIKTVEARLINNPVSKRTISTNKEVPYVKIFTEEVILIPLKLEFTIPAGYELVLFANNSMVMDLRVDLVHPRIFYADGEAFLLVSNSSDTTKMIKHGDCIAHARLIKTQIFDIKIEE